MIMTLGLWAIFLIVYALLVITLVFALFTRAFYLWIFAIFSPLFGLFYYLEGKGFLADLHKKFSFTEFIALAMVPVYVSAALGFGLMFVKMASDVTINPANSTFFAEGSKDDQSKPGGAVFRIGPNDPNKSTEIVME